MWSRVEGRKRKEWGTEGGKEGRKGRREGTEEKEGRKGRKGGKEWCAQIRGNRVAFVAGGEEGRWAWRRKEERGRKGKS